MEILPYQVPTPLASAGIDLHQMLTLGLNLPLDSKQYEAELARIRKLFGYNLSLADTAPTRKLTHTAIVQTFSAAIIRDSSRRPKVDSWKGLELLWELFIEAAQTIDVSDPLQDKLVAILHWTKLFDLECRSTHREGSFASALPSWDDYNFAGQLHTVWVTLLSAPCLHYSQLCNLAAFSARALTLDLCGQDLTATALWYFEEALERDNVEVTAPTLISAAVIWLEHCRVRFFLMSAANKYSAAPGVPRTGYATLAPGFNMQRWRYWRQSLRVLRHSRYRVVSEAAAKGFRLMASAGRDVGYEAPGDAQIIQEEAAAWMRDMIP